jgi:putative nucleotidyltransferase with HDIG domain
VLQTSSSFRPDSQTSDGSISLSEIISALSYALDLTEGAVHGHALRSCLLGMRIAAEAKLPAEQTSSLYFALLLKDIGCRSTAGRMSQVIGDPAATGKDRAKTSPTALIARILRIGTRQHKNSDEAFDPRTDRSASILGKLGMGEAAAEAVHSLDERWDGSGHPDSVKGEQIPLLARICAVAQYLDVFSSNRGTEKAITALEERSGSWFDPELVRIALMLHRSGALWTKCLSTDNPAATRQAVLDLDAGRRHRLEADRIDRICEAFADVVDAKSHFTFRHSLSVADTAFGIANVVGLSAERAQLVRRAGLLHDIGKLGIPNTILDKTGKLSTKEWQAVHQHPVLTRRILERVSSFREMAIIAGEHHEKLDGSGYPNRLMAPELSLESRMIAVADVYGALLEDRPYRPALELNEIIAIMTKLVPKQLDATCFEALISLASNQREVRIPAMSHIAEMPLGYAFETAI